LRAALGYAPPNLKPTHVASVVGFPTKNQSAIAEEASTMKRLIGLLMGMCVLFGGWSIAAAQEQSETTMPPPKILVIFREFVKPGKAGMTHEKSESVFVQAMAKAKWPTHYLAVTSMSGRSRALFITPYDSFDAWEKDNLATDKNKTLSAALDRAAVADGELLSDTDQAVLSYSEEYSLRSKVDIARMRYFEISLFHVRPGHRQEWNEIVKMVIAAYEKIPDAHWAAYEVVYGMDGGTYAIFTPLKSAAEIDHEFAQDKEFVAAMGEEGMKKLRELEASAIESTQSNLFHFSPAMSYVRDEFIKADPDFWKPKAAAPAMAPQKPAEKPAANQ
jgi:hypothetical protein